MAAKKPASGQPIPNGTIVTWATPGFNGPTWTGKIVGFCWRTYTVRVTHKDGKPMKEPVTMCPYAKRIHAQNPDKLKEVR